MSTMARSRTRMLGFSLPTKSLARSTASGSTTVCAFGICIARPLRTACLDVIFRHAYQQHGGYQIPRFLMVCILGEPLFKGLAGTRPWVLMSDIGADLPPGGGKIFPFYSKPWYRTS